MKIARTRMTRKKGENGEKEREREKEREISVNYRELSCNGICFGDAATTNRRKDLTECNRSGSPIAHQPLFTRAFAIPSTGKTSDARERENKRRKNWKPRARVVRLTRESHIGGKQALPGRRLCHVITIDAGFQSIVTSNAKGESRKFIRNFLFDTGSISNASVS